MAYHKLFGTDGIRGIANRHPMTAEIALQVGRAVACYFKGRSERVDKKSVILIGKDTRRSSYMIEQALAAGVTSQGAFALLVGPIPTPGVAFLAENMRADAGIMVSASHNSYEYNGIKLFGHDGFKLPDDVENEIERLIISGDLEKQLPVGEALGRAKRIDDAMGRYVVHVKSSFAKSEDLKGFRVVLDSAHGAAYKFAPIVFSELGAEVIELGNTPNGININKEVGALHPKNVRSRLIETRADIGIALDGDADRLVLVDELGEILDGDQVLAILAVALKNNGRLNKNTLVVTPMSNEGLRAAMKDRGIQVVDAGVGDRKVVDLMRREGYNLGGEQSGHIICLDVSSTGDGVMSALAVLEVMKKTGKKLSELKKIVELWPQDMRNIRVKDKKELKSLKKYSQVLSDVEKNLGNSGRVLVRYSGTEPLCRIMVESRDEQKLVDALDALENILVQELNG